MRIGPSLAGPPWWDLAIDHPRLSSLGGRWKFCIYKRI